MNVTYPEQRVSISEKLKHTWYINNAQYWINQALKANDKDDVSTNLDAANGIVPPETYDYVMKPLGGEGLPVGSKLPGEIRNIDFITPIKEKNIGEYIDLPYNYLVKVNDPEIVIRRKHEVGELIKPIIEQYVINKINEYQETEMPSVEIDNLEAKIEEIKESWIDKRAEQVSDLIEYINDFNSFEDIRLQGFYDWWATEHVFFELSLRNGQVFIDNVSPLEGYPILAGASTTEEGEGFMIKRRMSLLQVETYYGDKLSTEDRRYLNSLQTFMSAGGMAPYNIPVNVYKDAYGRRIMDESGKYAEDGTNFSLNGQIINEYIVYFKTETKKQIVTRINQLGVVTEEIVESDYELNAELGDIAIKSEWLQESWKQVLLGDFQHGIYIKPEPTALQIYDNRGNVMLPVIGKKGILKGIDINPIPKRILPALAFYRILNLQIERHIAKYKTPVEAIPKGLLAAQDGSTKAAMFYKMADSTIIYDETKFSGNELRNSYQIIGNNQASGFIRDLIDLRDRVKGEAWDLANMNDARYGNTPASATVRNNEQNIFRAKLGSILMTTIYNNILSKVHKYSSEYGSVAYADGLASTLFDKTTSKVKYFNIPGGELSDLDIGVFVVNSVIEKEKLDQYKQLAFAASQNHEFGLASASIDGNNVSTIREAIKEYVEKKERFEQEQAEAERASKEQIAQLNNETEKLKAENRLEEIRLKESLAKDRELAVAEVKSNNINNTNNN